MSDTTLTAADTQAATTNDQLKDEQTADAPTAEQSAASTLEQKLRDEQAAIDACGAAVTTASGRELRLPTLGSYGTRDSTYDPDGFVAGPLAKAKGTAAWKQLAMCFPGGWPRMADALRDSAINKLAQNVTLDPNEPEAWYTRFDHARAVLQRHGIKQMTDRITLKAQDELITGQAAIDAELGIDYTTLHESTGKLEELLRRAHSKLPIDLDDPAIWVYAEDRRRAAANRLGIQHQADDLSRWALEHLDQFDASDLRSWRIGSSTWLDLATDVLEPVEHVDRPVAAFVIPEIVKVKGKGNGRSGRESAESGDGWQLIPTLSLDLIRLVYQLGGEINRDLTEATVPTEKVSEFLDSINHNTLHAGPKENLDSAKQLAEDLTKAAGVRLAPGLPKDKRDRWGRLLVSRRNHFVRDDLAQGGQREKVGGLTVRVITYPAKGFQQRRLGNRPRDSYHAGDGSPSAVMELGEAVQAAVERGLPLLLSTEASGMLHGVVRVGRLKGRPGMVSITRSDGLSATTERKTAEQAVAELRRLKREQAKVIMDAGAKQVVRMTVAKPLTDDPILLGKQQEVAAKMVVGSGLNASQTGSGKCIAGDTRMLVNGALIEAEKLWQQHAGARLLFDGEGFWAEPDSKLTVNSIDRWGRIVAGTVSRLYRQHVTEVGRKVTLDDGSTITITNAHKLLGVDGWTLDVKPGDFVGVPGTLRWDGERLDENLVELLAWQIAEGHEPKLRRGVTCLRITQADRALLERLRATARKVEVRYGLRLNSMPITEPSGKAPVLHINSASYRRMLADEFGYEWGRASAGKRIPDRIVAADERAVAVFLRAFFDAEGSVSADRRRVEITSASREVVDQLAVMLRRFGVWLRISEKSKSASNGSGTRRTYWTGYLGGESLRRFADHIGFGVPAKAEALATCCAVPANSNVEGVPVEDLVREVRAAGAVGELAVPAGRVGATVGHDRGVTMLRGYRRAAELTYDTAARFALDPRVRNTVLTLDADKVDGVADRLHERLARDVFYARVVSVEEVQLDGWVYDLEVAEHHNFVAGGLLAHNTIMSGRTIYHRAAVTARFRSMVIAEGRLLSQWRDELEHGAPARGLPALAPNVDIVIVDDRSSVAAQIRAHDRHAGDGGVVFLVPNSILDRYVADLQTIDYHLLIADEAQRYINPLTEAHIALKQLRLGSVVDCWLLTATPKGKTAEDLDVLEGLALGDDAMIRERLNSREAGDLLDEVNAHRMRVNYGPHLLRVTREDMKAYMPDVRPAQPLVIEADTALAELLAGIKDGGRNAYRTLLEVVRELKTLEQGSELYKAALVEQSRAMATVLGNANVFVDASVDPETLKHSKAGLAQALVEQGIVDEAIRGGGDGLPLLRSITAQTIANVVSDEQVIVFAERNWCLRQLAGSLRDRYGVDARVADGSLSTEEFEQMKYEFTGGGFPVLCLSKVGQEGHNLQNASTIVHLDLPWTQKPLEQRVGRAARPGSLKGYVQTFIPYIKRGGIEYVVGILAGRGAEHHMLLDSFEGVAAADSTVANQLGQITADVAESSSEAGFEAKAARLRVAASVFGS